jgi:hypothetical protein
MPIYGAFKERILQTNVYNDIQFYPSGQASPLNTQPSGISPLMVILCSGSVGSISHSDTIYVDHQGAGAANPARYEISAPGYTRGGKRIQGLTGSRNGALGTISISGQPVTWTGLTAPASMKAVLYISGLSSRTGSFTGFDGVVRTGTTDFWNYLVAHIDLNNNSIATADFTINWNSQGILIFD